VCLAIEEHYRPTFSGGDLPSSMTGALTAIADKLDTICGCFAVDLIPTGASDPYALRRQGIGIAQIMLAHQLDFSIKEAIELSLKTYAQSDEKTTALAVYEFLRNRISFMLAEQGYSKDVINAVVSVSINSITGVWKRVSALQQLKGEDYFEPLAVAFKRVVNILRKTEFDPDRYPDATLFEQASEGHLLEAYEKVKKDVDRLLFLGDISQALPLVASLRAPIDRFFDEVLVMAEEPALRQNRLSLLQAIARLFNQFADFSKIAT
jgi:glycyl-tRNA synthetase beta chain